MDRAPLSGRQPHRNVALVGDRNHRASASAHRRRPPAKSARHIYFRHFMVEGAQPMKKISRVARLAGTAVLCLSIPATAAENRDPRHSIGRANDAARIQPERATFLNAIQKYAWAEGDMFQVSTAPGRPEGLREGQNGV